MAVQFNIRLIVKLNIDDCFHDSCEIDQFSSQFTLKKETQNMSINLKNLFIVAALATTFVGSNAAIADVKIGFLGGFTGPLKSLTPSIYKGAKLAVKQVNDQGGVLAGEKIVMPNADTTCANTDTAVSAAEKLVGIEKLVAIVGPICSAATIAVAENVTISAGVPMVSVSTSPTISTLDDKDLVFRTSPSDKHQGDVMARLLTSKGINKIAITYVANPYGKGFADSLTTAFKAAGGEVAASEAHDEDKADYSEVIRKMASSGVNTLVVLAYADGSGQRIIKQALAGGVFSQFVGGDGMVSNSLINAIGSDKIRSMIATKPGVPNTTAARTFKKLAFGNNLNPNAPFASQSYDAAFLLALAIEKNGTSERAGLSEALRAVATAPGEVILPGEWKKAKKLLKAGKEINYEGASGSHEFNKAGDVSGVIIEVGVYVREGSFIEYGQVE